MHRFDIGLQLYTVRDQMAADAEACLADVAAAGYRAVEFAGFWGRTPTSLRLTLDALGLRAVSSHVDISAFDGDIDQVIDEHAALGCEFVIIQQAESDDFADVAAVHRLADRCNSWGARLASSGLRLGYHGYHDFAREFAVVEGTSMFDLLVRLTDPELFDIQLDTYWVHHIGDDPVVALDRYRGRVRMLHCKEVGPAGDATVGDGLIDWAAVLVAAARSDVSWLIVEQEDRPAQAPQDIRAGLAYLTELIDVPA